jgi:hypothetical protein
VWRCLTRDDISDTVRRCVVSRVYTLAAHTTMIVAAQLRLDPTRPICDAACAACAACAALQFSNPSANINLSFLMNRLS